MAQYDITELSTALEFDTSDGNNLCVLQWSATRVILAWTGGASGYGYVQAFDVNAGTGAVTAVGSPLLIEGNAAAPFPKLIVFDSTHFIAAWGNGTAYAKVFAVDGSGNITAAGSVFTFSSILTDVNIALLDSTHFIALGTGSTSDGVAVSCAVNTGTWAITEPAATFTFESVSATGRIGGNRILKVDGTHCLITYVDTNEWIRAQILTINTSDWTITEEALMTVTSTASSQNGLVPLDGSNHFLCTYATNAGATRAQVLEVNLSTYAVTNVGTALTVATIGNNGVWAAQLDATHVLIGWCASGVQTKVLAIDGSWVVTAAGALYELETATSEFITITLLDGYRFVGAWMGTDLDGFIQAMDVEEPVATSVKDIIQSGIIPFAR